MGSSQVCLLRTMGASALPDSAPMERTKAGEAIQFWKWPLDSQVLSTDVRGVSLARRGHAQADQSALDVHQPGKELEPFLEGMTAVSTDEETVADAYHFGQHVKTS